MDRTAIVRGIVVNKGKILILKTASTDESTEERHKWELPGGTVDAEAAKEEAVRDEVMDETGLDVTLREIRERVLVERGDEELNCRYYLLEAETKRVALSDEHVEYQWINPDAFREYDWHYYAGYAIPVLERLELPIGKTL